MQMSVMDRLIILNLDTLPMVGSILTLKIKQDIVREIGFSEEEIKEWNIREDPPKVMSWDVEKSGLKDIPLGEEALKLLINAMEQSESLPEPALEIYDRMKALQTKKV
jgi:hypothetical protein